MNVFLRVLIGIAVMAFGFFFVQRTDKFQSWFGQNDWAEEKFGPGGTRTFYKLMGALICVIGVFIATNIASDVLTSLASIFGRHAAGS